MPIRFARNRVLGAICRCSLFLCAGRCRTAVPSRGGGGCLSPRRLVSRRRNNNRPRPRKESISPRLTSATTALAARVALPKLGRSSTCAPSSVSPSELSHGHAVLDRVPDTVRRGRPTNRNRLQKLQLQVRLRPQTRNCLLHIWGSL